MDMARPDHSPEPRQLTSGRDLLPIGFAVKLHKLFQSVKAAVRADGRYEIVPGKPDAKGLPPFLQWRSGAQRSGPSA